MIAWSYVGCEATTGNVLADLPLSGVKFTRMLNGAGGFSGTLSLAGRDAGRRRDLIDATDPGRRAIYALADGELMWGGLVWPRGYSVSDYAVTFTAAEWGSYFQKTILPADITVTGMDQLAIARLFISSVQAVAGHNARVALGSETSGVLRDRTYLAGDLPVAGEKLAELADVIGGFDFAWPAEYGPDGLPRGRLLLGHPRLGVTDPALVIDVPGSARSYTFDEDAGVLATTTYAVGKPVNTGDPTPIASASDPALIAAGYLGMARVERYPDVIETATLQDHADADQQANGGVLTSVTVTALLTDVISAGTNPGDPVRVELFDDLRHPDGFVEDLRVTQMDYDPTAGTCDLTLSPRITLGGRVPRTEDTIARLSREVRLLTVSG